MTSSSSRFDSVRKVGTEITYKLGDVIIATSMIPCSNHSSGELHFRHLFASPELAFLAYTAINKSLDDTTLVAPAYDPSLGNYLDIPFSICKKLKEMTLQSYASEADESKGTNNASATKTVPMIDSPSTLPAISRQPDPMGPAVPPTARVGTYAPPLSSQTFDPMGPAVPPSARVGAYVPSISSQTFDPMGPAVPPSARVGTYAPPLSSQTFDPMGPAVPPSARVGAYVPSISSQTFDPRSPALPSITGTRPVGSAVSAGTLSISTSLSHSLMQPSTESKPYSPTRSAFSSHTTTRAFDPTGPALPPSVTNRPGAYSSIVNDPNGPALPQVSAIRNTASVVSTSSPAVPASSTAMDSKVNVHGVSRCSVDLNNFQWGMVEYVLTNQSSLRFQISFQDGLVVFATTAEVSQIAINAVINYVQLKLQRPVHELAATIGTIAAELLADIKQIRYLPNNSFKMTPQLAAIYHSEIMREFHEEKKSDPRNSSLRATSTSTETKSALPLVPSRVIQPEFPNVAITGSTSSRSSSTSSTETKLELPFASSHVTRSEVPNVATTGSVSSRPSSVEVQTTTTSRPTPPPPASVPGTRASGPIIATSQSPDTAPALRTGAVTQSRSRPATGATSVMPSFPGSNSTDREVKVIGIAQYNVDPGFQRGGKVEYVLTDQFVTANISLQEELVVCAFGSEVSQIAVNAVREFVLQTLGKRIDALQDYLDISTLSELLDDMEKIQYLPNNSFKMTLQLAAIYHKKIEKAFNEEKLPRSNATSTTISDLSETKSASRSLASSVAQTEIRRSAQSASRVASSRPQPLLETKPSVAPSTTAGVQLDHPVSRSSRTPASHSTHSVPNVETKSQPSSHRPSSRLRAEAKGPASRHSIDFGSSAETKRQPQSSARDTSATVNTRGSRVHASSPSSRNRSRDALADWEWGTGTSREVLMVIDVDLSDDDWDFDTSPTWASLFSSMVRPSTNHHLSSQPIPVETKPVETKSVEIKPAEKPKKPINETQKNIIEGTLSFIFESIAELKPQESIAALKALVSENLTTSENEKFENQGILECIQQVRKILAHPCPQNRTTNYPYFGAPRDKTLIVYKDADGKAAFEKQGLLSLTARNDAETSVTKEAVVGYIHQLVNEEITKQHRRLEKPTSQIQFWYRRTRDENKALRMIKNKDNSLLAKKILARRK